MLSEALGKFERLYTSWVGPLVRTVREILGKSGGNVETKKHKR